MADHSTPEASASSLPATSSTLSDLYRAGNLDRFAARQGEPSKGGATSSQSDYGNEDDEDDEDSEYSYFNTSTGNGYQISDAQAEWEESLRQLEQLLTFILVPVIGKFFGRRFAYFVWGKITAYRYGARVMITDPAAFKAAGAVEAAVVL